MRWNLEVKSWAQIFHFLMCLQQPFWIINLSVNHLSVHSRNRKVTIIWNHNETTQWFGPIFRFGHSTHQPILKISSFHFHLILLTTLSTKKKNRNVLKRPKSCSSSPRSKKRMFLLDSISSSYQTEIQLPSLIFLFSRSSTVVGDISYRISEAIYVMRFTKMSGFAKNKGHQNLAFNDCPLEMRCLSTWFHKLELVPLL